MPEITLIDLPYQSSLLPFFQAIRHLPYPAILDSNHEHFPDTQFDILVANPLARIHPKSHNTLIDWRDQVLYRLSDTDNPMALLNELYTHIVQEDWAKNAPTGLPFIGGLLGYYGYESGHYVEQLPDSVNHDIQLDTLSLGLYGWTVVTNHPRRSTQLIITPWCSLEESNSILSLLEKTQQQEKDNHQKEASEFRLHSRFTSNMSASSYAKKFNQVKAYIQAGDCYQVNLAQRFSSTYHGEPFTAYQQLRAVCPTPFSAYLALSPDQAILSHSPERFLLCDKGRIESKPIKGTIARGETPQADKKNADTLLKSKKDRAENLMIVDLLRNDLGRTCLTGSIKVPSLFALESYANVHHLVSTVEGCIDSRDQAIHVFHESFPGGSITGAPKIRAMQIIDELEPDERSAYCGSIVYFSANGQMDSSITIRTLVADQGNIHCWAGGGLVADSICEAEYQETFTKVGKLTHTLEHVFLK
ncbi:Aminodeoxychorismate synthase component 1 [Marinomonas spartinae]|uniref:aminodeoxychorismate synthase component I n=1 Tax=Marinomonas spartinae TaxID=1792290 RepID=UPI000808C9A6|nr:aminodeoxychorismate synthase component I [Marinomonas spartinae]SBS33339.1 Aminodeoxychorismate synthase component 1 [Marinomonas spartinae]